MGASTKVRLAGTFKSPKEPSPQAKTAPSARAARLCQVPPAIATMLVAAAGTID